jgi:hypothetical protein
MITPDTVKAMTHVERMSALGVTVRDKMRANALIVAAKTTAEGLKLHADAARDANLLRY